MPSIPCILFLLSTLNGVVATAEFNSRANCENAGVMLKDILNISTAKTDHLSYICVAK